MADLRSPRSDPPAPLRGYDLNDIECAGYTRGPRRRERTTPAKATAPPQTSSSSTYRSLRCRPPPAGPGPPDSPVAAAQVWLALLVRPVRHVGRPTSVGTLP